MPAVERAASTSPRSRPVEAGPRSSPGDEDIDWVADLSGDGPGHVAALRELHALMLRACGHQVWRMRDALPDTSPEAVEVVVNQAADEAMTVLLGKLQTFEGRSRFTTWAFKFAILQTATEVRRLQWQHREVRLRDLDDRPASVGDDPGLRAEGAALADAVADAMRRVLTPYQRRIAVALLVDAVPIDVLAERLGTTRGALYKTLHDVRVRLRRELMARGYLAAAQKDSVPPATSDPRDDSARTSGGTR